MCVESVILFFSVMACLRMFPRRLGCLSFSVLSRLLCLPVPCCVPAGYTCVCDLPPCTFLLIACLSCLCVLPCLPCFLCETCVTTSHVQPRVVCISLPIWLPNCTLGLADLHCTRRRRTDSRDCLPACLSIGLHRETSSRVGVCCARAFLPLCHAFALLSRVSGLMCCACSWS
jgi:hypothetical protein